MRSRAIRIGLSLALVVSAAWLGDGSPEPVRAGDELLPDLAMAPLEDFRIEEDDDDDDDGRRLLRFTAMMVNHGPGHFEVRGSRQATSEPMQVEQLIYRTTEREDRNIARRFDTTAVAQYAGDGHDHWHVQDMMAYELFGGPEVVTDEKIGFCFLDSQRVTSRDRRFYEGNWCSTDPKALSNRMGISVGWGDVYHWNYEWQWVDITDLPSGEYTLRATVDPYGWFVESDEENQCTAVTVALSASSNEVEVVDDDASCEAAPAVAPGAPEHPLRSGVAGTGLALLGRCGGHALCLISELAGDAIGQFVAALVDALGLRPPILGD